MIRKFTSRQVTPINKKPYTTAFLCTGILLSWIGIALHSGQTLFEIQHSKLLLTHGAVDGRTLWQGDYWRIITSQFLHVVFPHMLLNLAFVYLLGSYIERQFGALLFLSVYWGGGLVGQYASVFFNSSAVSSGASQALCALAGFLLLNFSRIWYTSRITALSTLFFIGIQCLLDLHFASRLKEGHVFGFGAGVMLGLCIFYYLKKCSRLKKN